MDIKEVTEKLLKMLEQDTRHLASMAEGVKLLYQQLQVELDKENGRGNETGVEHSDSDAKA